MTMANLEGALKKSLMGINESFRAAERDLRQEVASVSESLEKVSGVPIRLALETQMENDQGVIYVLAIQGGGAKRLIESLRVNAKGYPIEAGIYRQPGGHFQVSEVLSSREALREHFSTMASLLAEVSESPY
jgi:hypothetical protein